MTEWDQLRPVSMTHPRCPVSSRTAPGVAKSSASNMSVNYPQFVTASSPAKRKRFGDQRPSAVLRTDATQHPICGSLRSVLCSWASWSHCRVWWVSFINQTPPRSVFVQQLLVIANEALCTRSVVAGRGRGSHAPSCRSQIHDWLPLLMMLKIITGQPAGPPIGDCGAVAVYPWWTPENVFYYFRLGVSKADALMFGE